MIAIFAIGSSPLWGVALWEMTIGPGVQAAAAFLRYLSLGARPALMMAGPALLKFGHNIINLFDISNVMHTEMALVERGIGEAGDFVIKQFGERKLARTVEELYPARNVVARSVTDLGSAPSGAQFIERNGMYLSLPPGTSPKGLPLKDELGDEMMYEVQRIADQFDPLTNLSQKQRDAIRNALPHERGGLMVAYKGTWVHQQMEKTFPQLQWFKKGIDARSGGSFAYEVMTWTEYGLVSHLGRKGGMDDAVWRAIFYTESSAGMASYLDLVLK
jgi:hypothetical protein